MFSDGGYPAWGFIGHSFLARRSSMGGLDQYERLGDLDAPTRALEQRLF